MDSLALLDVSRRHPARELRVDHEHEPLVLRPTRMTDAEQIASLVNQSLPELKRFMPWAHAPQTALGQLERLRGGEAAYNAGTDLTMALFRQRDGAMLTMVGLHGRVPLNPNGLEVGYWTPTPHAGRGWASFATKVALVYAFDKLGADRVQVMCDDSNDRSRSVIEKCGFRLEGVLFNVTAAPSKELSEAGYQSTGKNPMFAHVPESFAAQPWVSDLRSRISYVNLAGHVLPGSR
ncbi:MAG: GNAT family N-acetyltransferase [Polyangiaceae bacterium]|nr:GNAT family N-acetyltransferase [Polyangiaceae bacterium]